MLSSWRARRRPAPRRSGQSKTLIGGDGAIGEGQPAPLPLPDHGLDGVAEKPLAAAPSPSSPVRSRYSQAIWNESSRSWESDTVMSRKPTRTARVPCHLRRARSLGRKCSHCTVGRDGCKIYDTRPGSCRSFHCTWLIDPKLGAEWRPSTAKMVLQYDHPARRLAVHVDPEFPSAWRSEPYYRQLKAWTCAAIDSARTPSPDAWLMAPVLVYVDDRCRPRYPCSEA